jgi:putative addiction module CopG family antidote
MELPLTDEMSRFIDERVRAGRYAAPQDVVRAALAALGRQESLGQLSRDELEVLYPDFKRRIEEGLTSARAGQLTDGDAFFEELENEDNSGVNRKTA